MSKKLDPRVRRTRQLLRDALVELIDEQGYEKITVQDITQRATLNRATFYLHYRDKLDLLYQSSAEILQELVSSIQPAVREKKEVDLLPNYDQPHETFMHLFEQIALNSKLYKVYLTEQTIPYFAAGLKDIIIEFVANGIALMEPNDQKLTVPRDMAVRFYAAAFLEVIIWWLEHDMPYTPKFMATQLMHITIKGPYMDNPFQQ
ncbi:TetR/AcrR family transcriptional regulator [Lysinibacillus macroides]|uniref:TetR family transcriptional regulator n=1 Tax=Lysinibacillus macroides TaxID=33935 RepID=A0A0M9DHZ1_9BACI|nr:TetR/AcrR family transcriptional regulator [Lysinibacillus macroides]KOY80552.1 TetR family transcriptional regulator [Lysinibacillus macroides]QPR69684.1 TetR/AcrR family transcriptional regulator [Lysinibacillus macroides]